MIARVVTFVFGARPARVLDGEASDEARAWAAITMLIILEICCVLGVEMAARNL